jgi:hypothetical protein
MFWEQTDQCSGSEIPNTKASPREVSCWRFRYLWPASTIALIVFSAAERVVGMIPVLHSKVAVSSSEGRPMLSRRSTRTRHAIRCFMRDYASPPLARTYERTTCACALVSRLRSRPSSDDVQNIQGCDDQLWRFRRSTSSVSESGPWNARILERVCSFCCVLRFKSK